MSGAVHCAVHLTSSNPPDLGGSSQAAVEMAGGRRAPPGAEGTRRRRLAARPGAGSDGSREQCQVPVGTGGFSDHTTRPEGDEKAIWNLFIFLAIWRGRGRAGATQHAPCVTQVAACQHTAAGVG